MNGDGMQLEALKALLGDSWADVDMIVVVGCKIECRSDGLFDVSPCLIQQHADEDKGGMSKTDGATLLMMAGELLGDEPV